MKKIIKWCVVLLMLLYPMFLTAAPVPGGTDIMDIAAQLRLYEGFRGESSNAAKVISSYYLKHLSREDVFSDIETSKEQKTLKRVFNLTDIKLMTQATMRLKKKRNRSPFQVIVLNGRKLLVQLSGIPGQKDRFRVEVFEDVKTPRSLLETKIILPQKKSAVLGFEDSGGHIYFISFHRLKDVPPPPPPPLPEGKPKKPKPAPIDIKKTWLIRKVDPEYPKEAIKVKVEGKVVIEATTDKEGNVKEAMVTDGHPLLNEAALEAIKQWKYEPYILDGVKKSVKFTVVVNFRLKKDKKTKTGEEKPLVVSSDQRPKLIKKVNPEYPKDALKEGIQGKVVIEATTDKKGIVVEAKVIDGHPLLNKAALKALKLWEYEPYIIDGEKKSVKFTVVMNFHLKDKEKKSENKK